LASILKSSPSRGAVPRPEVKPVRRTGRGDERIARLRSAAATLFLERGYAGVSIDDIVHVAGGSKTNVYNHFGGKHGLFLAAVTLLCDELLDPLTSIDVAEFDVLPGLRKIARVLLKVILDERALALHRVVAAEALTCPDAARLWFDSAPAQIHGMLAAFIARHQDKGALRPGDPRQAAIFFHDMLTLNMHFQRLLGVRESFSNDELEDHIDAAITLFTHGFAVPARRVRKDARAKDN
jgi:AcrR family transcriptional regulator